ncbi:MAG: alpha/beta hydrolase [Thermaerobacterales bacterium]
MTRHWEHRYVDVGDVKAHYIESPQQDETAVLVHGGGVNSSGELNYGAVMPYLGKEFHVVAVDIVGFGLTPGRGPQDYSAQGQGDFLIGFIKTLGRPVHLGGNSAAGYLIQYVAHEAPELVKSLIIINSGSGAIAERRDDTGDRYDPTWAVPSSLPTREAIREQLLAFYSNQTIVTDERVERTFEMATHNYEFGQQRQEAMGKTSADRNRRLQYRGRHISEWAGELEMPVLMTWSRENRGCSPEQAMPLFNRLQNGEMHVMVNAGHHIQTEHPERWSGVVAGFIRSH